MTALLSLLTAAALSSTPFEAYLATEFPPADGFSAPLGSSCAGPGVARAIGHGRVVRADGAVVEVEHVFYENAERRTVRSTLGPMKRLAVREGEVVSRMQVLGVASPGARLSISGHPDACDFISGRTRLFVPQREPLLVLVDHQTYRTRVYESGVLVAEYPNGFGQELGAKQRRGDNRTPKGMYFVTQKSRGPFGGPAAAYFGGHWVKVNYPNRYDADRGVAQGWLTPAQARAIRVAWQARKPTNERTLLGGGIGFHGWAHEWSEERDGRQLSWGCVVLHLRDVRDFYARVPVGAMVVLM